MDWDHCRDWIQLEASWIDGLREDCSEIRIDTHRIVKQLSDEKCIHVNGWEVPTEGLGEALELWLNWLQRWRAVEASDSKFSWPGKSLIQNNPNEDDNDNSWKHCRHCSKVSNKWKLDIFLTLQSILAEALERVSFVCLFVLSFHNERKLREEN
jgi:hypothetical protein